MLDLSFLRLNLSAKSCVFLYQNLATVDVCFLKIGLPTTIAMQTRSASLRDSNRAYALANNKRARDEPPRSDDIVRAVVEVILSSLSCTDFVCMQRTKVHCMWLPLGETEGYDSIKPSAAIDLPIRDPWSCSAIKARRKAATRYVDTWAKESNEFSSLFLFGSETHFGDEDQDKHEELRTLTAPLFEKYKEDPVMLRDAGIALLQAAELTNAAVSVLVFAAAYV